MLNGTRHICDDRNVLFDDSTASGRMLSVEESSSGCSFPVLCEYFPVFVRRTEKKLGLHDTCVSEGPAQCL